jgi:hypothetical protein
MMMQMLFAAGHPCLTDQVRPADIDNPRGYFEFEKAKRLRTDASWLSEARGKAVKIIAQLLPFLPSQYNYRVIFMERDFDEILASQHAMLERQKRKGAKLSNERLRETFCLQVRRIKHLLAARRIPTLYVGHHEVLEYPNKVANRLKVFLGENLDEEAIAGAIDRSLYRQQQRFT